MYVLHCVTCTKTCELMQTNIERSPRRCLWWAINFWNYNVSQTHREVILTDCSQMDIHETVYPNYHRWHWNNHSNTSYQLCNPEGHGAKPQQHTTNREPWPQFLFVFRTDLSSHIWWISKGRTILSKWSSLLFVQYSLPSRFRNNWRGLYCVNTKMLFPALD